jgi:hypothetical protein
MRERRRLTGEQLRAQEAVQARSDISRIEANVKVFTENESQRRKQSIRKSMKKNTKMISARDVCAGHRVGRGQEESPGEASSTFCATHSRLELCRFDLQLFQGCSICLESFEEGDIVMHSDEGSTCRHLYHEECALNFLSSQSTSLCPCCRQQFGAGDTPSTSLSSNEHFQEAFGGHAEEDVESGLHESGSAGNAIDR